MFIAVYNQELDIYWCINTFDGSIKKDIWNRIEKEFLNRESADAWCEEANKSNNDLENYGRYPR